MSVPIRQIESRQDLKDFINLDLAARGLDSAPFLYQYRKPLVHYTILLRKAEYYENSSHRFFTKILSKILSLRLKMLGAKLGFSLGTNTFGPGLYLVHWGSVVISSEAKIGPGARIHSCVNISGSPRVGENLYMGPGAVIAGNIVIGDNVTIGANSVVTNTLSDNVTVVGNPGRVVKRG